MLDAVIRDIFLTAKREAVASVALPYPKGTPEDEQDWRKWTPYHEEIERQALRAVYEAGAASIHLQEES